MKQHRDIFAFLTGLAGGFCSLTEDGWGGISVATMGLVACYLWRRADNSATARNEKD